MDIHHCPSLSAPDRGVSCLFCAKARRLSGLCAGSRTQSRKQSRIRLCLVVRRAHAVLPLWLSAGQSTPLGCAPFPIRALHLLWLLQPEPPLPPGAPRFLRIRRGCLTIRHVLHCPLGSGSRLWRRSPSLSQLSLEAVGPFTLVGELFSQGALGSFGLLYFSLP